MDLKPFQHDLQNGMTIHDACLKHGLSFQEAFHRLHYKVNNNVPVKNPYRRKETIKRDERYCPSQYIQCRNGRYYLRKNCPTKSKNSKKNTKTFTFGTYSSLEDAERMREALEKDGWHQKHVDRICKELGVVRCECSWGPKGRYH